jgi:hypothetical protein
MVNRANDVIANVPKISMDTNSRNNIVGNARFLRALGYFELVRSFGEVPLLITPTSATSNLFPPKAAIGDIYTQIISDLQYAEANCLPESNIIAANKKTLFDGLAMLSGGRGGHGTGFVVVEIGYHQAGFQLAGC